MSQTKEGVSKFEQTMIKKHGSRAKWKSHMARIGRQGGKISHGGGFADGEAGRERARKYGAIGGKHSRRGMLYINGEYFPIPKD